MTRLLGLTLDVGLKKVESEAAQTLVISM